MDVKEATKEYTKWAIKKGWAEGDMLMTLSSLEVVMNEIQGVEKPWATRAFLEETCIGSYVLIDAGARTVESNPEDVAFRRAGSFGALLPFPIGTLFGHSSWKATR